MYFFCNDRYFVYLFKNIILKRGHRLHETAKEVHNTRFKDTYLLNLLYLELRKLRQFGDWQ